MHKYKVKLIICITCLCYLSLLCACNKKNNQEYQGYVDGRLTFYAAPFSGILKNIYVSEWSRVKPNQLLFQLDKEPQLSQLIQAKSDYQQALANLTNLEKGQRDTIIAGIEAQINSLVAEIKLAKVRVERSRKLYEKNVGDKDSYDAAASDYNAKVEQLNKLKADLAEAKLGSRIDLIAAQKANVATAQAKIIEAEWALMQKTVRASIDAYIFERFFNLGELVPENQPVFSSLASQDIYFVFFVPLTVLPKIKVGQTVWVNCDECKKTYRATIYYISPKVEFTPPVIFSRQQSYKYVMQIRAYPKLKEAYDFHLGQPVYIRLSNEDLK